MNADTHKINAELYR